MGFKNFRLGLVIRTIMLGTAIFFAVYSAYQNEWYVTTIVSSAISVIFLIEIIRYSEKYKRSLTDFLLSIKSRDFVSSAVTISDKTTRDILHDAYNTILDEFKNIRIDKEVQYHYLKTMIEHIKIALFSYDETGNIQFINKTASILLNVNQNQNIKKIEFSNANLYKLIQNLKSGENELVKLKLNDELLHLSVYATELKIQAKSIKLISLQNIKQELEYQELESWQKLIRVLTHEIMNSVTPISSLSNAINETLDEINGKKSELLKISDDDFEDILTSLRTIENRSKGLLKFVSSYKQLTRIPKPDFKDVNLVELVNHCTTLLKQKFKDLNIQCTLNSNDEIINCLADYDQIEQVIINLLINAIEAVKNQNQPQIFVEIIKNESNKHKVLIKDNGKGIDPDETDKIFIPFYTTKKEGSGIGLSLSRQIMHLHKGTIQLNSDPERFREGKGTEFILEF
ncbi:MAG: HAMP domain-containing histidine kinase [Bacteroidales bacterium]|nr:HAMP domain-containing histidine kinase [Bacteroidales bacterium]